VEVSSVTPFSARALDRGFAGALVGLARHAVPQLTPPRGVEMITEVRALLERQLLDAPSPLALLVTAYGCFALALHQKCG
jgi:hypothetical protein